MKRFTRSIIINMGLVLALGVGAASMSSAAHADKIVEKPSNYAMHLDQIGPAPAIGQSTAALKKELRGKAMIEISYDDH